MKSVIVLLLVCGAVGACSFKSQTTVEKPVAPATTTVVTADPAPPPTTVVVR